MRYEICELEINSFWDDLEEIFEDDDYIEDICSHRKFFERNPRKRGIVSGSSEEDAVKNWHNAELLGAVRGRKTYELSPAEDRTGGVMFVRNEYSIVGHGNETHKQYSRTCLVWAKEI